MHQHSAQTKITAHHYPMRCGWNCSRSWTADGFNMRLINSHPTLIIQYTRCQVGIVLFNARSATHPID